MVAQGKELRQIADNVIVKVPMTQEGVAAGARLTELGIPINVTLVFSPAQAILAARIGATFVSPFLGRVDDIGNDGMGLLREIVEIYTVQAYETEVLAASLRHPQHVVDSARIGADIGTMPFAVMEKLFNHPLTDIGNEVSPRTGRPTKRPCGKRKIDRKAPGAFQEGSKCLEPHSRR